MAGNGDDRKQLHVYLKGDQIQDYELVKLSTGITNDSDLVRYVFRQEVHRIRERLAQTPPHGIRVLDDACVEVAAG